MLFPPLRMLVGPPPTAEFYSSKVMNGDWERVQNPSCLYVSSTNKTIVSWMSVGLAGDKCTQVAEFNHNTNTWSRRYNAGNFTLANDNHGFCGLCRDASGYFHIFYGSHDSNQLWASSNNPDDITGWTQHAPLSGGQTYPHPMLVGSTIFLYLRNGDTFPPNAPMSVRTCTPVAGVGSFGAQANLINFDDGTGSRVYTGECYVIGTDVHFVAMRSDETDVIRQHVYYYVHKTATGALENHDGSFSTPVGSLPVLLASANTNYRLISFGVGTTGQGDVPSLTFDSAGDPHIIYAYNGGSGTTYTLFHIKRTAGVWSAPVSVATVFDIAPGGGIGTAFVTNYCLVPGAGGTVEAWYINANGDKLRRVRSAAGVWSAAETILVAGSLKLVGQQAVRSAHASFRSVFSEVVGGAASDSASVPGKRYGYGDSGMLAFAMPPAGSVDALWPDVPIMLGFDSRDGTTRIINESDSGAVVTPQGTAQVDTAQSKFGGASLLLNAGNAHLTFAHNALYSVSNGDFTIEGWFKRNSVKLHCIAAKNPSVGSSEWRCFIDASNHVLLQAFSATVAVINIAGTTTVTTNWHHIAFTRQGTTWRCFLDGNLEASAVESAAPISNTSSLLIGRDPSNLARDFNGWMDELRFTEGTARYTANFTAPVAAFPRI
jgi:hypothetical protein